MLIQESGFSNESKLHSAETLLIRSHVARDCGIGGDGRRLNGWHDLISADA